MPGVQLSLMTFLDRVAILLDGGYVKKRFRSQHSRAPLASDIAAIPSRILRNRPLSALSLYRIFYYDAEPYTGTATNPLSNTRMNFATTEVAVQNQTLLRQLELLPNFAVRRGALVFHGWQLGNRAERTLLKRGGEVLANDLVPKLEQKGVDMRIGLDIATLALKQQVGTIVLVTGDSDMLPAMKCARREGIRVCLDTMGSVAVRNELKVHADVLL